VAGAGTAEAVGLVVAKILGSGGDPSDQGFTNGGLVREGVSRVRGGVPERGGPRRAVRAGGCMDGVNGVQVTS
jgi:hypothetical protein